jgi:hypothetical protein
MTIGAGRSQAASWLTPILGACEIVGVMAVGSEPLRIMLGFVVRQCTTALGHDPTPEDLAEWANNQRDGAERYAIFGRAITVDEARVILRHPGRLVTVRPGRRWGFATTAGR